jgi:DNA-binding MarR family transcriptional regulator
MACADGDARSPVDFEGVDPLSASVFRARKRTMRLNRRLLMRTMSERGGHPAQAGCLWTVAKHDGISQRDLAEALHLAPPTVTAMLQKMERHGFVERWSDEDDQRLTRIRLTQKGRDLNDELRSVHAEYIRATIGTMPEAERRELERLLDMLSESIETALTGPSDDRVPS